MGQETSYQNFEAVDNVGNRDATETETMTSQAAMQSGERQEEWADKERKDELATKQQKDESQDETKDEMKEKRSHVEDKKMNEKLISTLTALQNSVYKENEFMGMEGARAARAARLLNLPHQKRKNENERENYRENEEENENENENSGMSEDSNNSNNSNMKNDENDENDENVANIDMNVIATERMWIEAIAEEPKSSHLRTQLANYYFQQSRLKEASYTYEQAIQLDPQNIIAHYDYAFMKHHQFYFALAQFDLIKAQEYAEKALEHYHCVLKISENDIETHYQLSLLYLTLLETCMPLSMDNIQSILSITSIELIESDLCKLRQLRQVSDNGKVSKCENLLNLSKYDELRLNKMEKMDYPVCRGRYSPWFDDRLEYCELCHKHIKITMENVGETNPVLYGTYISHARLLYMECVLPLGLSLSFETKQLKLEKGIEYLTNALDLNEYDATLHHDLALLLSHECISDYENASNHWQIACEIEENNYIYYAQLGYLHQYCLKNLTMAKHYYEKTLQLKPNHYEICNYLAILNSELIDQIEFENENENENKNVRNKQLSSNYFMNEAKKWWQTCLEINHLHCETHRNLGNSYWIYWKDSNMAEIHLQKAISISKQLHEKIVDLIENDLKIEIYNCENEYKNKKNHISMVYKSKYHESLLNMLKYYQFILLKCKKFVSQTLSDYGGMLLMMYDNNIYHLQAENSLKSSLEFDDTCVGAHYYLGKYYCQLRKHERNEASEENGKYHLNMYLTLEDSNNVINLIHVNQLLGDLYLRLQEYNMSEYHYKEGLKIISKSELKLPQYSISQIHGGYAQSILVMQVLKMKNELWILDKNKGKANDKEKEKEYKNDKVKSSVFFNTTNGRITGLNRMFLGFGGLSMNNEFDKSSLSNIKTMEHHFGIFLKMNNKSICANLGLALLYRIFIHKPKKSESYYRNAINLICQELIKYESNLNEHLNEMINENKENDINNNNNNNDNNGNEAINESKANEMNDKSERESSSSSSSSDRDTGSDNGENDKKEKRDFEEIDNSDESSNDKQGNQPWKLTRRPSKRDCFEKQFSWTVDSLERLKMDCNNVCKLYSTNDAKSNQSTTVFFQNIVFCQNIIINEENRDICDKCIAIIDEMLNLILMKIDSHLGLSELLLASFNSTRWKECISQCKHVLCLQKDNLDALQKIGSLYYKLGLKDKAFVTAKHALSVARSLDEKDSNNNNVAKLNVYSENAMANDKDKGKDKDISKENENDNNDSNKGQEREMGALEKKLQATFDFVFKSQS